MLLEIVQIVVGILLVLGAGHFLARAIVGRPRDFVENAAYSLLFGLLIPPLLLLAANLLLGIKINNLLVIYAAYLVCGLAGYLIGRQGKK